MSQCQHCGASSMRSVLVEHHSVLECQLCGEFTGNQDALDLLKDRESARERGMDNKIFPLVKLFETIKGLTVVSASEGTADLLVPPFVAFSVAGTELRSLEKLLQSLQGLGRKTSTRWIVQATLQKVLVFEFKPDFAGFGAQLNRFDIQAAMDDLGIIHQTLERDMGLSWWSK